LEDAKHEISFVFSLPPSTNHLYQRTRYGGVALTKAANAFKEHVRKTVADDIHLIRLQVDQDTVYSLDLKVFFTQLENKGWFKKTREGKHGAKTRYKDLDVDNRIKFLQDCIAKALQIPTDAQFFEIHLEKHEDPDNPRAEVVIAVTDRDRFFKRKE
jgi:Holliday junction resolvase RusA-like endonuclease